MIASSKPGITQAVMRAVGGVASRPTSIAERSKVEQPAMLHDGELMTSASGGDQEDGLLVRTEREANERKYHFCSHKRGRA